MKRFTFVFPFLLRYIFQSGALGLGLINRDLSQRQDSALVVTVLPVAYVNSSEWPMCHALQDL